MLIQTDICVTSFSSVRFKEEELYRPEKWCLWQKWQRIIHHRAFLCGAVIKPKWDCTSLVIYFTDHYIYTNSITLLHFYGAIHYSTSHTTSTWQHRNAALSGEDSGTDCRAAHGEETHHSQKSRSSNVHMKQENNNRKQWNRMLRDGRLKWGIVLQDFCLTDAPFDLESRIKRGRPKVPGVSGKNN